MERAGGWRSSVFKKSKSCYSKGIIIKTEKKNPKLNINTLLESWKQLHNRKVKEVEIVIIGSKSWGELFLKWTTCIETLHLKIRYTSFLKK